MLKSKKLLLVLVLLTAVCGFMYANHGTANAEGFASLIKISPVGGQTILGMHIEPSTAYIKKGDAVVWLNQVISSMKAKPEVSIEFADGKKCKSAVYVEQPYFKVDEARQCFVTTWMPYGTTSSLEFINAGTYEYTVKVKDAKDVVATGKIIVE